jgi:acyl-CoA synthetase (AMP-forming)/AMP-acid ligase II
VGHLLQIVASASAAIWRRIETTGRQKRVVSRLTTPLPFTLMVRGPLVMLGYYGNEQATAAAIEPDGWMHTGDIASRDDEGHYFIVDRRKDLIIAGAFNVYPAEIERVVASHPAVAMVAVGSVPDETLGELARACPDAGLLATRGQRLTLGAVLATSTGDACHVVRRLSLLRDDGPVQNDGHFRAIR